MTRISRGLFVILFIMLLLSVFVQAQAKEKNVLYTMTKEVVKDNDMGASSSVEYPVLGGSVGIETKRAFNIRANNIIGSYLRDYKRAAVSQAKDGKVEGVWILEVRNRIMIQTPALLSVIIQGTSNTGGAQPASLYETLLFDVKNGTFLELDDLFKPSSNYIQVIANYCTRVIRKQGNVDESLIKKNLAPMKDNFKLFYVSPEGLGFIFPPGSVGGTASATKEVVIPYVYLKKVINKSGYLGDFLKQ
ncbi:MAG: DUF3298 and DUF4163 domain-containing protein [Firmicutes bacterium]|nr:DUF3298 and DUF4163 domain-containing protein [Bacillota bacterium]